MDILRLQTTQFIAVNPRFIALIPRVLRKSGGGSVWEEESARATQVLRLIDQSGTMGAGHGFRAVPTNEGVARRETYQLLGAYDAEIGMNDIWRDEDGTRWEVIELLPFNGYERRAQVVRYAQS